MIDAVFCDAVFCDAETGRRGDTETETEDRRQETGDKRQKRRQEKNIDPHPILVAKGDEH